MSIKNLKKQLAASVAMVAVASVALGSSTYAWFANNNKVQADGLTISAQSEGVMLIIDHTTTDLFSDAGKKTSKKLNINGANLHPTHPVYAEIGTSLVTKTTAWNHAYSDTYDVAVTKTGSNETAIAGLAVVGNVGGVTVEGETTAYYLVDTLAIGVDDTTDNAKVTKLRVSECVIDWDSSVQDSAKKDIINSVRVMITDASNDTVLGIYGNNEVVTNVGATQSGEYGTAGFTAAVADEMDPLSADLSTGNSPILAAELAAGQANAKTFNVYVYFDGRDEDCNSADFSASDITVALTFIAE